MSGDSSPLGPPQRELRTWTPNVPALLTATRASTIDLPPPSPSSPIPSNANANANANAKTSSSASSWIDRFPALSDDPTHPAQIALRTYALALSLSLGPAVISFATQLLPKFRRGQANWAGLRRVLRRELGIDGFAFSVTLSVAGGAGLRCYLSSLLLMLRQELGDKTKTEIRHSAKLKDHSFAARLTNLIENVANRLKGGLLGLTPGQQIFLSYALSSWVGVLLLQSGRERAVRLKAARRAATSAAPRVVDLTSPTLDLTLLLLVRAVDSVVQGFILKRPAPTLVIGDAHGHAAEPRLVRSKLESEKIKRENKIAQMWTSRMDAVVFWACSARIMWCFFYEPQRLPRSYVKWINTLANLDGRIIDTLQNIREGKWSYIHGSSLHSDLLQGTARGLGLPAAVGNPNAIPAYGGAAATEVWKKLGLTNRPGVGGIPCELLHGEVGSSLGLADSCTTNAGLRLFKGFTEALAIYLPVHFVPVLLMRPQTLMRPHRFLETLTGAVRSASFLSSFIAIYWYTVCLTRTLVLARLFPFISHDFWDGPLGCIMAGCLTCGSSIWIENGRRRGEMALYVLPRALRAWLPNRWVKSGNKAVKFAERLTFAMSLATLLTAAMHRPDTLRGLSRWTLAFVTNGPNAGFWKRKRQDPSVPPTPSMPASPLSFSDSEPRLLINDEGRMYPAKTI